MGRLRLKEDSSRETVEITTMQDQPSGLRHLACGPVVWKIWSDWLVCRERLSMCWRKSWRPMRLSSRPGLKREGGEVEGALVTQVEEEG